ncbi:Type IV secretion-system coupling protein DNA-binding domain-containing protein [Zhouia amylolytica]|uniref:Type IV secretion-system coupling protein DNA-binding domain-containing protein n=1 Tax=Zhouia amylolytica TaxID=376730 RepID=A0A1I6T758_9FLAO|nr:TraM recognition domain-containing protein [Zhouia amylolytica]SFS85052.1 Type IV secretion-system coupling protein DNA-binding domain-containing protein [Zhouia amylolytica]
MEIYNSIYGVLIVLAIGGLISFLVIKYFKNGLGMMMISLGVIALISFYRMPLEAFYSCLYTFIIPWVLCATVCYGLENSSTKPSKFNKAYRVTFKTMGRKLVLENIRRGVSIIAAAGSGKTQSIIYGFLKNFYQQQLCGVIHDYKDFEITEMAYPLFKESEIPFYIISFDPIHHKVNPIAPRYLPDEESVYEVSRVLLENLMESKDADNNSTTRFFKDAVEGLVSGLIWRLKSDYPDYCTIPHLIALYQQLSTKGLIKFLRADMTSRAMADAFISGIGSDKQTAGVKSTLANAFKKITTKRIFITLSADEVPLDINSPKNPAVICVVNNPKKDSSLSPVIATIIHTITKQMSQRHRMPSFLLLEEASTLKLLNMHRIPATLRSYDIATIYVLQDKIQNDMMYGEKASRAILSNLSYQFFGKANDPDTAKYYEGFFERVKAPTRSVSKSSGMSFQTRITKGEREVAKRRAEVFYKLRQGEFVVFADGKDRKVRFKNPLIDRFLPDTKNQLQDEMEEIFEKIHREIRGLFQ